MFGKYLEPRKEHTRLVWSKPRQTLDWCNIWPFYRDFHELKLSYHFFNLKKYDIRNIFFFQNMDIKENVLTLFS